eukprot:2427098-Pleurochrysis_carterae.AAC.1
MLQQIKQLRLDAAAATSELRPSDSAASVAPALASVQASAPTPASGPPAALGPPPTPTPPAQAA